MNYYAGIEGNTVYCDGEIIATFKEDHKACEDLDLVAEVLNGESVDPESLQILQEREISSSELEDILAVYDTLEEFFEKKPCEPKKAKKESSYDRLKTAIEEFSNYEIVHYDGLEEDQVVYAQHALTEIYTKIQKAFDGMDEIKSKMNM